MNATYEKPELSDAKAVWMTTCVVAVFVAGLSILGPSRATDKVLKRGQDAVLLHYINHSGWSPVRCEDGRHLTYDTLYCHPADETRIGGLHIIERERGKPVVYPINGTAMGNMKQSTIEAADTSRVLVRQWRGPVIDIPQAVSELIGPADRAAR